MLTLRKLRFHAKARGLNDDSPYWVCTYANNQHGENHHHGVISTPSLHHC